MKYTIISFIIERTCACSVHAQNNNAQASKKYVVQFQLVRSIINLIIECRPLLGSFFWNVNIEKDTDTFFSSYCKSGNIRARTFSRLTNLKQIHFFFLFRILDFLFHRWTHKKYTFAVARFSAKIMYRENFHFYSTTIMIPKRYLSLCVQMKYTNGMICDLGMIDFYTVCIYWAIDPI